MQQLPWPITTDPVKEVAEPGEEGAGVDILVGGSEVGVKPIVPQLVRSSIPPMQNIRSRNLRGIMMSPYPCSQPYLL
jgi:hypothetical protein